MERVRDKEELVYLQYLLDAARCIVPPTWQVFLNPKELEAGYA
jgi:hypothetical protein